MFNSLLIFSAENEKNDSINSYTQNSFYLELIGRGPATLNYQFINYKTKPINAIAQTEKSYGFNLAYLYVPYAKNANSQFFYCTFTSELKEENRRIIKNYGFAIISIFNKNKERSTYVFPYFSYHKRFHFNDNKYFVQYGVNVNAILIFLSVGIGFDI